MVRQFKGFNLHSENTARAKRKIVDSKSYSLRYCAKLSQSIARNSSWGIVFGRLHNFVVSLCLLSVFKGWLEESI